MNLDTFSLLDLDLDTVGRVSMSLGHWREGREVLTARQEPTPDVR